MRRKERRGREGVLCIYQLCVGIDGLRFGACAWLGKLFC